MDIKKYFVLIVLMSSSVIAKQQSTVLMSEKTIIGHAPYLTMDDGVTKITSSDDDLLSIQLSDGQIFNKTNNTSTQNAPIELPVALQTALDIKTILPISINSTSNNEYEMDFDDLVKSPYNLAKDDDDDTYFSGTGSIKLVITDALGNKVKRDEVLNGCGAPYKLELTATEIVLSTKFGYPNKTQYLASNATYYVKPKASTEPVVCAVRANMKKQDKTGFTDDFVENKGFKVIDVNKPSKNFPRTGFDGAFFNLVLKNTNASSVISATGSNLTSGGVTVKLERGDNDSLLKINLTGPNHASKGGVFTPSTFEIKASNNKVIYSFELSKWFVANPTIYNAYEEPDITVRAYCATLSGNYYVPSVSEFTNGNGSTWAFGTAGVNNDNSRYSRAIGNGKQKTKQTSDDGVGGLLSEWGSVGGNENESFVNSNYPASDFKTAYALAFYNILSNNYTVSPSYRDWVVSTDDGSIFDSRVYYTYVCVNDGRRFSYNENTKIITPDGNVYDKFKNPSTKDKPLELDSDKIFNDIFMPNDATVTITDAGGKVVDNKDILAECYSPYKLTVSKNGDSADYYFKSKSLCNAKVLWVSPDTSEANRKNGFDYVAGKGFKVIDVNTPSKNFPRTGFDGATFSLVLDGITADEVIQTTGSSLTGGGLTLKLESGDADNKLKISLSGPNVDNNGGSFSPTTFKIKAGNNVIYSFELSKWFVIPSYDYLNNNPSYPYNRMYGRVMTYCASLNGNYRLPSVSELTNVNDFEWEYGTPGIGFYNSFRAVGNGKRKVKAPGDDGVGGLLVEWGDDRAMYWTEDISLAEPYSAHFQASQDSTSLGGEGGLFGSIACVSDGKEVNHNTDIKIASGETYTYNNGDNSTEKSPITLPYGTTFNDIKVQDGAAVTVTDLHGNNVDKATKLSVCDTHKLTVTKSGDVAIYYLTAGDQIDRTSPTLLKYTRVCSVQPNMQKPASTGFTDDFVEGKGFKVIGVDESSKNFPRSGFDGASFTLKFNQNVVQDLVNEYNWVPERKHEDLIAGGVTVKLEKGNTDDELKVTLHGPNHNSGGGSFKPSKFVIRNYFTRFEKDNILYHFELSKWFIVKPGNVNYADTQAYCASLKGNYRVTSVSEYTNGNGNGWNYGTPGINNEGGRYSRAIGDGKLKTKQTSDDGVGGLFAEWGSTNNQAYPNSGFLTNYNYWASDAKDSSAQWVVSSDSGFISYHNKSDSNTGAACVTDGEKYFDIRLSNGDIYTEYQSLSTKDKPIELPVAGQTFNDVTFSAGITAKITDANGATVARDAALISGCDVAFTAPYKLTLSKNGESVDYYFKPKAQPQVCYVRANPDYDYVNSQQTTKPYFEHVSKNNSEPHKNFPRTGFDKAFFLLDLWDVKAQNIIDTMTDTVTTNGGLTLKLTAPRANQLKVELNGPNHSSTNKAFKPSVVSLKAGNKVIYSFEVSKWFIIRPDSLGSVTYPKAISYCQSLPNYRMPSVSEMTNGNRDSSWTYGTPGINNDTGTYTRAIGNGKRQTKQNGDDGVGGLFAEWGYADSSYYTGSGFANSRRIYWAAEAYLRYSNQWVVGSIDGSIYTSLGSSYDRAACVTDGKEHFDIRLSNGDIYAKEQNPSTVNAPIELPEAVQTFNDVTFSAGITAKITDANGATVARDAALISGCDATFTAPYKLTLSKDGESVDYYFKPKAPANAQPQVCYVRANPEFDFVNSTRKTKPYFEHVSKNNSEPHKNFPRTGFDKAFFLLDLANVTAKNVIDTMTDTVTTNGGLTLKLTAPKANQLKVELNGPNHSSTNKAFKPSVVSLKAGNKVIYSFEVSKWFIIRPESLGKVEYLKDALSYCQSLPNYRMPSVSEMTNGNRTNSSPYWTDGTPGINNDYGNYTRAIGNGKRQTKQNGDDGVGGLFAEWGYAHSGYYTGSGFASNDWWYYWAAEAQSSSYQWIVNSHYGYIYYFSSTSNGRAACVTDGKEHFDIRLSNGDIYAKEQNPSTVNAPIELPEAGQTFNDVTFSAGITAKITDASGATVARDAALSGCGVAFTAPYKLTLSKDGESVDYYFKPKAPANAQPQVCYVRANPEYDFINSKQTTKPYFEHVSKNNSEPHKNFPRTGFDKAFFLLDLVDVTAQNIMDTMTDTVTTNGGLTLKLTAPKANQLKVELNGPNHSSTNKAFKPSVVSLKAGNKVIYSFEVSKWFIIRPESLGKVEYPKDAISYCQSLPNYRMPSVSEMTNGNKTNSSPYWTDGTPGINNDYGHYTRAIGNGKRQTKQNGDDGVGGLFAEWGYAHSGYYTGSGFASNDWWYYWAAEAQSSSYQWSVYSINGFIHYISSNSYGRAACVTP